MHSASRDGGVEARVRDRFLATQVKSIVAAVAKAGCDFLISPTGRGADGGGGGADFKRT